MERISKQDLPIYARRVLDTLLPKEDCATLLTLSGDLGAGKTTFVQALAHELGIKEPIQSPTYVLMKKYELKNQKFKSLVHLDLYRLSNASEFGALKPDSFLKEPKTLVCVEWPGQVGEALPKGDIELKLSSEGASEEERYFGSI